MKRFILFTFFIFACLSKIHAQDSYPLLTEICTDNAKIMTEGQLLSLRQKLSNFETETSHQIVVLTINNLDNESIENYALQVFNHNKLGQKDEDNGLLILFVKNYREVRIEVGQGLEPIITDAIASRLIRNVMIPEFKEERYFEGIDAASDAILNMISDPKYAEEFATTESDSEGTPVWAIVLFVLFFGGFLSVFVGIGFFLLKKTYKDLVNLYRGLISGKISLLSFPFMLIGTFFAILFGAVFTFFPLGVFAVMLSQFVFDFDIEPIFNTIVNSGYLTILNFIILLVALLVLIPMLLAVLIVKKYDSDRFKLSLSKNNKSYIKKHISMSSSSGSSSGGYSSSSSSSGFSGGGGSSGGGGASGSW